MGMEFWRIFNRSPEKPLGSKRLYPPGYACRTYMEEAKASANRGDYEEAIKNAKEAEKWGERQGKELYMVMCELLSKPLVPSRLTLGDAVNELAAAVRASVEFDMGDNQAFDQLKRTVQWREWQAKEKLMALIYEPALTDDEMLKRLDSYKEGRASDGRD